MSDESVLQNLNQGLRRIMQADADVYLVGQDLLDPYGGAFKVTKGLSTEFPGRVISTPVSEQGMIALANGISLAGGKAIVEVMFGDFIALAFDQLLNFAAKVVSMFGRPHPHHLVVRCPVGGHRGYGATHSQSPQKHFIGIPDLDLYEMSPFHDAGAAICRMLESGRPCLFFECKTLYPRRMYMDDALAELFRWDMPEGDEWARIRLHDQERCDVLMLTTGSCVHHCLGAARRLFLEREIMAEIRVASKIYPFDLEALRQPLREAQLVLVVEEGPAGGTWGDCLAQAIHGSSWGQMRNPVISVASRPSVIPAAPHLERDVLVEEGRIVDAVLGACHG